MTAKNQLLARVSRARNELQSATTALEALLVALPAMARAEKVTMTPGVREAFTALTIARAELAQLERELKGDT